MAAAQFKKGAEVEISSNDDGFRGSWYDGTVLEPPTKKRKSAVVQYKFLTADEKGTKPLTESVDVVLLRPPVPREPCSGPEGSGGGGFALNDEVDAFHSDGWWEGVITKVLGKGKYSVFFRYTREQIDFKRSELRRHREWVNGKWEPPIEEEEVQNTPKTKSSAQMTDKSESLGKGSLVEVSSDEDGFRGCWFAATIIKPIGKEKFLIEYEELTTEDNKELLREEFKKTHVRPRPPKTIIVDNFNLLDEVDALYNDGWWVGVISKVLRGSKYKVSFKDTNEELIFALSDLRPHQEWINGKWVFSSPGALNL